MPAPDLSYPDSVLELLARAGERTVFEHGDRHVTGTGMLGLIRRVVVGLRAAGLGPGDGVAVMTGVTAEAFAVHLAAHAVGTRVAGIRPGLTAEQLGHILDRDIDAVITDGTIEATGPRTLTVAELLRHPDRPLRTTARPDDIARLIHTSGSTGRPKACAQTYAAMSAGWNAHPDRWPPVIAALAPRLTRHLVFGSLSSQVMMEYGILALAAGGTMVVADDPGLPDAIVRHQASSTVITVPRLRRLITAQRNAPADLSSLRALMVSGSPIEPKTLREAHEVLGPVVFHGYGQTETGMIAMAGPDDTSGSVGHPPDSVSVTVLTPDGSPTPPGVDGEIVVHTPSQATEYWNDPTETASVFRNGNVHTRDRGHLAPDGRLHLTGRLRDVIIVNANLHYAGPIEQLLTTHPAIAEAYVIAVPDDDTGEAVHAFVVPTPGHTPDAKALRKLIATHLGPGCIPARIATITAVPVAPSGKPNRSALPGMGTELRG